MARRRKSLLVPEARQALDALRNAVMAEKHPSSTQPSNSLNPAHPVAKVASALGIPYRSGENGQMTARQAGTIGGDIGGTMVKKLIHIAQRELANEKSLGNQPLKRPQPH